MIKGLEVFFMPDVPHSEYGRGSGVLDLGQIWVQNEPLKYRNGNKKAVLDSIQLLSGKLSETELVPNFRENTFSRSPIDRLLDIEFRK